MTKERVWLRDEEQSGNCKECPASKAAERGCSPALVEHVERKWLGRLESPYRPGENLRSRYR